MARQTASGFTISGLLDRNAATRSGYPVEEIPVEEIADHPANAVYSMDEAGIEQLARSIEEEGLTDLPLVRKLGDGSWQMVSGHRRKAAYALLAKKDAKYSRIPCRIIRGITDEQSVMLLHAANYFVRSLTVTERAAASRALGVEVERMRAENPELAGVRTEDIKAAIISEQTALKNFAAGKYDREKVFVIAKEPETMLRLVESGVELPSLVVGGSLVKEDGIQLTQRAYASAENVQSYKALIARGVKVTAQFVPADKPVSVADLI